MQDELTLLLLPERGGRREVRRGRGWGPLGRPGRDRAQCARACAELKSPARLGGRTEPRARTEPPRTLLLRPSAMAENCDKVPIALVGPDDVEFCSPPVSSSGIPSPAAGLVRTQGLGFARVRIRRQGFVSPNVGEGGEQTGSPKRVWGDAGAVGFSDRCEGEGDNGVGEGGRPVAGGGCRSRG